MNKSWCTACFLAAMVAGCTSPQIPEPSTPADGPAVEVPTAENSGMDPGSTELAHDSEQTGEERPEWMPKENPPADYESALHLLREKKFPEAEEALRTFLSAHSTSKFTLAATYDLGRTEEGLDQYGEAAKKYRSVTLAAERVAPRLQAAALFRLSFCHEALGEDRLTVAVLLDLVRKLRADPSLLPEAIGQAEVPARLAGAYARKGNYDLAIRFYKNAERGINRLFRDRPSTDPSVQEDSGRRTRRIPDWMPRTLYEMGRVASHQVSWEDFASALRPLAYGQSYLLQAAEFSRKPWSTLAANELISQYQLLLRVIESPPMNDEGGLDPILQKREVQEKQWQRAIDLADAFQELTARKAPGDSDETPPEVRKIFSFIDEARVRISTLLENRPAGEGLTPESAARTRGWHGRVVSPDGLLEQKFLSSSRTRRLPEKANAATRSKANTKKPGNTDAPKPVRPESTRPESVHPSKGSDDGEKDPNL